MGDEHKDNSFKSLKHSTLFDLTQSPKSFAKVEIDAKTNGHFDVKTNESVEKKETLPTVAAPAKEKSERGRFLVFTPTGEVVTVVKENVGQSYAGDWIHEVVAKSGKKFLSSTKQLRMKERK